MTTIVFDGKTLAVDSQQTTGANKVTKSEYKSARSLARKILREGFKSGRVAHAKAWDSLGSQVYFFSLDSFQRPVSMACCLFLCRKYGRKTTDFI